MTRIYALLLLIFTHTLVAPDAAGAAESDLFDLAEPSFTHIDTGSNDTSIYQMVISDSGRLWLAADAGIFYYDGYEYKALDYTDAQGNKFKNYTAAAITKGKDGILWVGSYSRGLFRIDEKNRTFRNFLHDPTDDNSLLANRLTDVLLDGDKGLWVSSSGGISYLNFADFSFKNHALPESVVLEGVKAIAYDPIGNLFFGTTDGLFYFDTQTFKSKKAITKGEVDLKGIFVAEIIFDDRGRLWIGTVNSGAYLLNPDQTLVHLGDYGWIQDLKIIDDEVWLASGGRGIVVLDLETGKHKRDYQSDLYRPAAMATNDLTEIFMDEAGLIWISAWKSALWMLTPSRNYARSLMYTPSQESPPSKADVSSVIETDEGEIWVASKSQGIDIFDPVTGYKRSLSTETTPSLPSQKIEYIFKSKDGVIWIGTNDKGIWALKNNPVSSSDGSKPENLWTKKICLKGSEPSTLSMPVINEPGGKGVVIYSYLAGIHRAYLDDNGNCQLKKVVIDSDKIIMSGGALNESAAIFVDADEFHILPNSSDVATKLTVVISGENEGLPPEFEAVQTTKTGKVFFHTGEDLYEKVSLDGDTLHLKKVFENSQNPAVFNEDDKGNIWGAGGYRLAKEGIFRPFAKADGYTPDNGVFTNALITASGTALAAYSRGLKLFRTADFELWQHSPKMLIQEISIDGVVADGSYESLTLEANNSDFSLKFSAIDFTGPDSILYRYFLEGYSKDWAKTDASNRFASYTNLAPGEYTFRLQSTNRLGVWSNEELSIPITVLPAWYQTWGFRVFLAIIILASLYGLFLWRIRYYREKKVELELLVHKRTVDLEKSMSNLKLTQSKLVASEKQASLGRLVSGVAHEINTPLGVAKMAFSTAQSSALELFQAFKIDSIQDKPVLSRFTKFQKSAIMLESNFERLSNLVNSFKQISVNDDEWKSQPFDINILMDSVIRLHRSTAKNQSIELTAETEENLQVTSYPELIGQILSGLIENAIQHGFSGLEGGRILVQTYRKADSNESSLSDSLIIKVTDNGNGIASHLLPSIFDPFTAHSPSNIGLGLHVITNRVDNILKGEIVCENLEDKGCSFTLTIPLSVAPSQTLAS